ncbi:potassium-transporting ATPase subunit KdpC [Sphingopyxis sp. DBS4]|uniref:potassium-transporting ATPase subunit KdpC n=1 Tax=Sphingopyxis sp. DBS4 TaxID=2968500 RepID=UPI00214BF200|nr:potassium-transporting ATPase subunit KdpC [Sphingopyxis sp. DBS4]
MNKDIIGSLRPALVMTLLFAALLGLAYPLAITAVGQALFPVQANGSLVRDNGRVVGSTVVGQAFASDRYFHSRPSAAGGDGYDGLASSGSNLGPTSRALAERVKADVARLSGTAPGPNVPPDLVTTSASGLDPHISPEAALYQVERVAHARSLDPANVRRIVEQAIETPLLGFLGEPRVNLFKLNRRLDALGAKPAA